MIHTAINAAYCPYRNRIAFALFILSLRQKNPSAPQRSEIFQKIVDQQRFSNINMKTSVSAQHSAGVLAGVPRLLAGAPRLQNRVRTEQAGEAGGGGAAAAAHTPGRTGRARSCVLGSTCGGAAGGMRIAAAMAAPAAAGSANVRERRVKGQEKGGRVGKQNKMNDSAGGRWSDRWGGWPHTQTSRAGAKQARGCGTHKVLPSGTRLSGHYPVPDTCQWRG
jgi:hypothetical protein